ncbi:MAG TPA: energy transducer TonB [Opitutaceae bacterium]|nr:energy transducer TonB [Opitutaceae bacterium]
MKLPLLLAGALGAAFAAPALRAQNVLLLQLENGRLAPVVDVRDLTTYVEVNGRPVLGRSGKFQLRRAPAYADSTVRLQGFSMRTQGVILNESAHSVNNRLYINGTFTASPGLASSYLAFEGLDGSGHPKSLGVVSLPLLPDGRPIPVNVSMPIVDAPDQHNYHLHVFAGMYECRLLGRNDVDFSRARTLSADQRDSDDRNPRPYFAISPDYPAALRASGPAGTVMLHIQIGADGTVLATSVVQADRPEFGASAQDAVSQWLFAPAVRAHRYVPIEVNLPLHFHPPKPTG